MTSVPPRLASALASRYRIDGAIGRGGMADVYRALDLKHERTVALKVLREDLAASVGAERFLLEIRTTAHLQHPHILPLFDSGEAEGHLFYVMPFVEGESLADRLTREKQLPADESVRIAQAVASALDYAHRHGVVHRDIKPENILLHDEQPLVADFGIALAVQAAGGERLTATGLRVGTPAYMSPEQIADDSRIGPPTDVYALGCVLYEMLAGEPPYKATTIEALLGRIVSGSHAPVGALRRRVPPNVAAAIERSLEPVPADRFHSAREFAEAIGNSAYRNAEDKATPKLRRHYAAVALLGWLIASAVAAGWILTSRGDGPAPAVARLALEIPPPQQVTALSIAPDARTLFYAANGLYGRPLDATESARILQTDDARDLAVGPGGEWIAFVKRFSPRADTLFKVRSTGGPPVKIAIHSSSHIRGIAWDSSGYLIVGSSEGGLWRVSESGGELTPLTTATRSGPHRSPHVLPHARGILFHIFGSGPGDRVALLPVGSRQWRVLTSGREPVFVAPDLLVFYRFGGVAGGGGSLWAARFDLDRLELVTEPVPIATNVRFSAASGRAVAAWSVDGSLYYVSNARTPARPLVWVSPDGVEEQVNLSAVPPGRMRDALMRISPDGRFVLRSVVGTLWIDDLKHGVSERLTGEAEAEWAGVWTPDARGIVFGSRRGGAVDIYRISLGTPRRIDPLGTNGGVAQDWTPDGKSLLYVDGGLRILSLEHHTSELLLDESVAWVRVSPSGRFLAYQAIVQGSTHVFVRPFPDVQSRRWLIPAASASQPTWSRNGRELYYLEDGAVMAVSVDTLGDAPVQKPRLLFKGPYAGFDVAPGGRLLAMRGVDQPDSSSFDRITVVQNWQAELENHTPKR